MSSSTIKAVIIITVLVQRKHQPQKKDLHRHSVKEMLVAVCFPPVMFFSLKQLHEKDAQTRFSHCTCYCHSKKGKPVEISDGVLIPL